MSSDSFNDLTQINKYIKSDRWKDLNRKYLPEDIQKLRAPFKTISPISERGASKLWKILNQKEYFIINLKKRINDTYKSNTKKNIHYSTSY